MLSGEIKSAADIPEGDFRRTIPRFFEENFSKNLKLVKELQKLVQKRGGITPAQLAISWVRSLSEKNGNPIIIPIPGATKEERIFENAKEVTLSPEELQEIDAILESFKVEGDRYSGPLAALMNA
jgi:pyridoxine 4-dehydrogenase